MSPGTVRRVHAILSASLNYAMSWGWMDRNPADHAHPPKLARRRALPPQPEQVAELLNAAAAADDELAVFLWLAVTSGARRGELVALRWENIDFDRGLVRIGANYVVRSGQRRLKGTKTDDERWLSLDALTVQLLQTLQEARGAALVPVGLPLPAEAFVFSPDPLGQRPWHPDHFTHAYRTLADELGIVEPLKNLRHFNATQLLAAGVDLRTTAGRLGHSDGGATTLRVYANWTRPADQRAAELLATDLTALRQQAAAARRRPTPSAFPAASPVRAGRRRRCLPSPGRYGPTSSWPSSSGSRSARAGSRPAICFRPCPTSPDTADSRGRRSAARSGCSRRRPSSCGRVRGGRRRSADRRVEAVTA